jgi:hypothetical protein
MRKSKRTILSHLFKFRHLDSSCCRDKVSRAAGRRSVGSVFCSPLRKWTVTSKLRFHYRDSYVREFYRDGTTCVHLPGLAKNSPTPTQTAPNHTTEPLGCNNNFHRHLPACPDRFAALPGQLNNPGLIRNVRQVRLI